MSVLPGAKQLYENLTDSSHDERWILNQVQSYMNNVSAKATHHEDVVAYYRVLMQRRLEVFASELSSNPRGQILEPGFRVIFPVSDAAPAPGTLAISAAGDVVDSRLLAKCSGLLK